MQSQQRQTADPIESETTSAGEAASLLAPLADAFLPAFLKLASIQPGERVLILEGAPGTLIEAAAERAAPDGEILVYGRPRPLTASLPVGFAEGPLGALRESYWDVAICHLGAALLADPVQTLEEINRLLRPVGRVALSAWALPERVRWLGFPLDLLARRGLGPPAPAALPLFRYGAPGQLSRALAEAGFEDVTPERAREDAVFESFDHYWRTLTRGAPETARPLARLSEQERESVRQELERIVRPYQRRDGQILLPMEALILAAVK